MRRGNKLARRVEHAVFDHRVDVGGVCDVVERI